MGVYSIYTTNLTLCRDPELANGVCITVINWIVGPSDQTNSVSVNNSLNLIDSNQMFDDKIFPLQKLFPIAFGHFPNGFSFDQLLHYLQIFNTGLFQKFNFGHIQNLIRYKRPTPPDYNLENVKVPVAVYYAESDTLTVVQDVKRFIKSIPNVVNDYLVPHKLFNHIDFILGIDAPKLFLDEVVRTMKSNTMTNNVAE